MKCFLPAFLMAVAGCHEAARTPAAPAGSVKAKLAAIPATVVEVTDGDPLTVMLNGV